ncbi:MAG TPA: hypothetical protein VLK84_06040 [Longimicrobium sp.]|nr:hypothetical protein [Longimicrobium sp.]
MPDLNEMYRQMLAALDEQERQAWTALQRIHDRQAVVRAWAAEDGFTVQAVREFSRNGGHADAPVAPVTPVTPVTPQVDSLAHSGSETETLPIAQAAEKALKIVGKHLRPRAMADTITANNIPVNARPDRLAETVGAVVARRAGENKVFTRAATGLYGLKEWNGLGPSETEDDLRAAAGEEYVKLDL